MAALTLDELFLPGANRVNLCNLCCYLGPRGIDRARDTAANRNGVALLMRFRVLPNRLQHQVECPTCLVVMTTFIDRFQGIGWRFRCPICRRRYSPTTNTLLQNVRMNEIGADTIVKMAFYWLLGVTQRHVRLNMSVAVETVVAWFSYFRDVAHKIALHDFEVMGGRTDVVEIDETHLFKRKYNVGRVVMWEHTWLFGGISRTTKKVFGEIVAARDAGTLWAVLQRYVDPDTFICSDMWAAYRGLDQMFSGHGTVNHTTNFLYPPREEDPLWFPIGRFHENCNDQQFRGPIPPQHINDRPFRFHIQRAENSWLQLKRRVRKANTIQRAHKYVSEWMYRTNILNNFDTLGGKLERFLSDCARAYPGIGKEPMADDLDNCECVECV